MDAEKAEIERDIQALVYAMATLLDNLFPSHLTFGRTDPALEEMLAHLLVVLGLARVRNELVRKPPAPVLAQSAENRICGTN